MNRAELRARYVENLLALKGTRYDWGGENSRGIDCSGLPRKALRQALLAYGIRHADAGALRKAAEQWWFDASAAALRDGYRSYTIVLAPSGTIRDMDTTALEPGDLAVTRDGVHVMVFLGGNQWIQADPTAGTVIASNGRTDPNPWFRVPVVTRRWQVLE